jgi:isoleucyl-tRNA synthetase
VLDAQGRAMHKSLGNTLEPADLIPQYGAEIVRWWALATDWRSDVRVGKEILERDADGYRKVRNTFRFLLGNLSDFTPDQALPASRLTAVDRAFAGHLAARLAELREHWRTLTFHRALDGLLQLCTVDLSAVFLDVAKDRLYTLAPGDPARRSAQTVLWRALHDFAIAAAPALVFTAEEVWQSHPALVQESESVHLTRWPEAAEELASAAEDWALLISTREFVNAALEPRRASKELATTAEAEVVLRVPPVMAARLAAYESELAGFLIVARATVEPVPGLEQPQVEATRTTSKKCDRCWMYRSDVEPRDNGSLCGRCVAALESVSPR